MIAARAADKIHARIDNHREETHERGHGRYNRYEKADISRPGRALSKHCALKLRHHPFLRGSDRHLSRLYEALRWLRRASGAECFDAARLPAATGLGLFPWRSGIFWRRSARRGISHAAARAHFTVQMAIVTYWHAGNGYFFSSPRGGWEFPLLLTILYAAIFFRGAGRCAVDRMIGKEF